MAAHLYYQFGTGKAICFLCEEKIEKGDIAFCFSAYNASAQVHPECVIMFKDKHNI